MANFSTLLTVAAERPRIFISYHHRGDQDYYNRLSDLIHDQLDLVYDSSLNRGIDSDNMEYVYQRIRDEFLTGTSCTLVLCGAETWKRKFVDWEIKATLDKGHGLIGIGLPQVALDGAGRAVLPARLLENYHSGYALWQGWNELVVNPPLIRSWIAAANARDHALIHNAAPMRERNSP